MSGDSKVTQSTAPAVQANQGYNVPSPNVSTTKKAEAGFRAIPQSRVALPTTIERARKRAPNRESVAEAISEGITVASEESITVNVSLTQPELAEYANEHPALLLLRQNVARREQMQAKFPFLSLTGAAKALGYKDKNNNASKFIEKLQKEKLIFTVKDVIGKKSVPLFLINESSCTVYPIVCDLLNALGANSASVDDGWVYYNWFVNAIDDEGEYIPAEMLGDKNEYEDLLYYAEQAGAELAGRALT